MSPNHFEPESPNFKMSKHFRSISQDEPKLETKTCQQRNRSSHSSSLIDTNAIHSSRYEQNLPVVMITDTNGSYTDIVELDTYEDTHQAKNEIEIKLRRQLKTNYQPRFST